jgi:hypothetical protein
VAGRKSQDSAESLIPEKPTLAGLQEAAANCKACDLWENATQTVFGEGKRRAKVLFIGEQPGNDEDLVCRYRRRAFGSTRQTEVCRTCLFGPS